MAALESNSLRDNASLLFTASAFVAERLCSEDENENNSRCASAESKRTSSTSSGLSSDEQPKDISEGSSSSGYQPSSTSSSSGAPTKEDISRIFIATSQNPIEAESISVSPPLRQTSDLEVLFIASSLRPKSAELTSAQDPNQPSTVDSISGAPARRKKSINVQVKAKVNEVTSRMGRFRSKIRRQVSAKRIKQLDNDNPSSDDERGEEDSRPYLSLESSGDLRPSGHDSKSSNSRTLRENVEGTQNTGDDKGTSIGEVDRSCLVTPFVECHDNEIDDDED